MHGGEFHRPWHYGGKHSSLHVVICQLAYCWCKIWLIVVPGSLNLKIDSEDPHVWRDASHIMTVTIHVLNHHLSHGLKIHVHIFKRYPIGISVLVYGSVQARISDGSSSTNILYVISGTECWIFPRHQHWHLGTAPPNIWDCIESYAMHISLPISWVLLNLPKTKLIIFEQRVLSSVLPPLTEKAPLFVFCPPTKQKA